MMIRVKPCEYKLVFGLAERLAALYVDFIKNCLSSINQSNSPFGRVTKSHCENPTCPRDLIYPPDDCHVNDTLSFSLQVRSTSNVLEYAFPI